MSQYSKMVIRYAMRPLSEPRSTKLRCQRSYLKSYARYRKNNCKVVKHHRLKTKRLVLNQEMNRARIYRTYFYFFVIFNTVTSRKASKRNLKCFTFGRKNKEFAISLVLTENLSLSVSTREIELFTSKRAVHAFCSSHS